MVQWEIHPTHHGILAAEPGHIYFSEPLINQELKPGEMGISRISPTESARWQHVQLGQSLGAYREGKRIGLGYVLHIIYPVIPGEG
jgi:hypothetical protein